MNSIPLWFCLPKNQVPLIRITSLFLSGWACFQKTFTFLREVRTGTVSVPVFAPHRGNADLD